MVIPEVIAAVVYRARVFHTIRVFFYTIRVWLYRTGVPCTVSHSIKLSIGIEGSILNAYYAQKAMSVIASDLLLTIFLQDYSYNMKTIYSLARVYFCYNGRAS